MRCLQTKHVPLWAAAEVCCTARVAASAATLTAPPAPDSHDGIRDTLLYSPLATLFGVLRGVGTCSARNRFSPSVVLRCFDVLDALLEHTAQESDKLSRHNTSRTSGRSSQKSAALTQLNLNTLRAVVLSVRGRARFRGVLAEDFVGSYFGCPCPPCRPSTS